MPAALEHPEQPEGNLERFISVPTCAGRQTALYVGGRGSAACVPRRVSIVDMRSGFVDRADAGEVLAAAVADTLGADVPGSDVVVLGLPRGGIPVAAVVAGRLHATLDLLAVRKVGAPGHVELAIGAIASGGLVVVNDDLVAQLGLRRRALQDRLDVARRELDDQERRLRGDRPRPQLEDRVVVLVDDGVATGATMRAAVLAVRTTSPRRIVAAVPVGPPDTCAELAAVADDLVCPVQPPSFVAVGQWYRDFSTTTDADVLRLLAGQ
jgi:putative phosphoribosyl transferase